MADKQFEERNRQRANLVSHLHAAAEHLRQARVIDETFRLNLEVPHEITRAIRDVIDTAAHAHQQENPTL